MTKFSDDAKDNFENKEKEAESIVFSMWVILKI